MLTLFLSLGSVALGFVLCMILFPQNKEVGAYMVHQLNSVDDYYDGIYSKKG